MYANRLERLMDAMRAEGIEVLALNPGPSLIYLTGLPFHLIGTAYRPAFETG